MNNLKLRLIIIATGYYHLTILCILLLVSFVTLQDQFSTFAQFFVGRGDDPASIRAVYSLCFYMWVHIYYVTSYDNRLKKEVNEFETKMKEESIDPKELLEKINMFKENK